MKAIVAMFRSMVEQTDALDVLVERGRQEERWGTQNHDPFGYLAILMEEVGKFS